MFLGNYRSCPQLFEHAVTNYRHTAQTHNATATYPSGHVTDVEKELRK